jgi:hypothetical protein
MIQAMQSSVEGERFLVSGSNQSFQDLFTGIAKAINKSAPKYNASLALLAIAWRFELVRSFLLCKSPLLTKNSARTIIKKKSYSSQKLIQAFSFEYTPFEETLRFTGNCFLRDNS